MWEELVKDVLGFAGSLPEESTGAVQPTREQFTRLLAEPAAARRIPGISARMTEDYDYECTPEEAAQTRDFLGRMFHVDSKEHLLEYQRVQFTGSVHYEQFMTFWKDAPLFDVNELNPQARQGFEACKNQAAAFYPALQEKGLYAWDISEYIGICRSAKACGIITADDFNEIVDRFVAKAQVFYHSFKEYALGCLCGAMYFMGSNDYNGLEQFVGIQKRVIANLFAEGSPWQRYSWYRPAEREWAQVYPGNPGCFISKAAFTDGIGYMYRDEGSKDHPDSGWRFWRGDEPDEYANNPDNIEIVSLNTICNLRPDILAYLEAPVGSAYGWDGKEWVKEPLYNE